jgi:hypothetical protein
VVVLEGFRPVGDCPRQVTAAVRELPHDVAVLTDGPDATPLLGGLRAVVHAVPRSFRERRIGLRSALEHGQRLLGTAALATGPLG